MKDANVTEIQEAQSLLTIDDLVMEIGRMHVEQMNKDRVITGLKIALQQKPKASDIDAVALKTSNDKYQENNRVLDGIIVKTRNELSKVKAEVKDIDEKYGRSSSDLNKAKIDLKKLNEDLDNVTSKNSVLTNNLKALKIKADKKKTPKPRVKKVLPKK